MPSPIASGSPSPAPGAWTPPARTKTVGCATQAGLPDAACTPGAVDSRVNAANIASTICVPGYSRTVRPSTSVTDRIKRAQMAAYGVSSEPPSDFELDHLISLELGGAPEDVANLWPEPLSGGSNAHQKDAVENYLHEQVCRNAIPLSEAQRQIATDWETVFRGRNLQPATESVD